jgi:hypothetical protein
MRRLLPGFAVEQNDRPFASLDRASGFWLTALALPIERHVAFLIRRPDCLTGRPDSSRAPRIRPNRSAPLATKWQYANSIDGR